MSEETTEIIATEPVQTAIGDIGENQNNEPSYNPAANSVLKALEGLSGGGDLKESLIKESGGNIVDPPAQEETTVVDVDNTEEVGKDLLSKKINEETEAASKEAEVVEEKVTDDVVVEKEKEKAEEKEAFLESSIFAGGKQSLGKEGEGKEEGNKPEVNFDNQKEIDSFIKENTGYGDLTSLINDSKENKLKVEGLGEIETKMTNYENVFNNMPPELYKGIQTFFNGGDWKEELMSAPNLDFTKPINEQSSNNLVESYFPGAFSQEDWDEYKSEDADAATKKSIDIALNVSKDKFNADQERISNIRKVDGEATQKRVESFNSSLDDTISDLQEKMPNVDKLYLNKMKKSLNVDHLTKTFLNKDGSLRKDAAMKLMMAEEGFALYEQYKGIAQNKADTEKTQEILDRTSETPRVKKRATTQKDEIRPEVQKRIDKMLGLNPVKTY